jgi:hypothetical protein
MNEKDTLSVVTSIADLRDVLIAADPDVGALQEWPKSRDAATKAMCARLGYGYGRPARGGGPVIWKLSKYRPRSLKAIRLVRGEFVGHLLGRRSRLGPSWCTEAIFDELPGDKPDGSKSAILGYHFTAEVQDMKGGGGYKKGLQYLLRVRRHKKEKRRLGRRARRNERRGIETYAGGDSNFSGMELGGFRNCWDGYEGGDLGGRAVTIVFAAKKPAKKPQTFKTKSDHLAVVVTYP